MDNIDKYLEQVRQQEEEERQVFMDKCANKIRDGEFIYHLLGLALCERFKLDLTYDYRPPYVVWGIVNYYVDNIDEEWIDWLSRDDAPIIRPISHLKKIFPELVSITTDNNGIIKLAKKLYGLDIKIDTDMFGCAKYFYAYSFNFNSFKPLPIDEIKAIKEEKKVLIKHGYDVSELDEKLSKYGLTSEELEVI